MLARRPGPYVVCKCGHGPEDHSPIYYPTSEHAGCHAGKAWGQCSCELSEPQP